MLHGWRPWEATHLTRRLTTILLTAFVLTTGFVALPATSETPGDLEAGTAKAEITPPVTTPLFAYTARHGLLATGEDLSDQTYPRFLD